MLGRGHPPASDQRPICDPDTLIKCYNSRSFINNSRENANQAVSKDKNPREKGSTHLQRLNKGMHIEPGGVEPSAAEKLYCECGGSNAELQLGSATTTQGTQGRSNEADHISRLKRPRHTPNKPDPA